MILQNKLYKVNGYTIIAKDFNEALRLFNTWRPGEDIHDFHTDDIPVISKLEVK